MTKNVKAPSSLVQEFPSDKEFLALSDAHELFMGRVKWKLRHTNPANPVVEINWSFTLPSGGYSTDPENHALYTGFRVVVWGMIVNLRYGKALSLGTLGAVMAGVRELFRWLVWKGVRDFSEISQALQAAYLRDIPTLVLNRQSFYGLAATEGYSEVGDGSEDLDDEDVSPDVQLGGLEIVEDSEEQEDGFTYAQVSSRILPLYYIYAQRRTLEDQGLPVIFDKPFSGDSAGVIASKLSKHVVNRLPALPEAVCLPLLSEVIYWIDELGPKIVRSLGIYLGAREASSDYPKHIDQSLDLEFIEDRLSAVPWREPRFAGDLDTVGGPVTVSHRLRIAVLSLRDACVLAIQFLAGFRISEVCSVTASSSLATGLPSCLSKRSSPDGIYDMYFLSGEVVKGRTARNEADWVVGCVIKGSNELPLIVRAVAILHQLFAPYLSRDAETPLFLNFGNPVGIPVDKAFVVPADGVALLRGMRRFIRCFVNLADLPDFDNDGVSLVRYRESRGQCIRSHQGRKTFGTYCLSTRESSLQAVSSHFRHLSVWITLDGYYSSVARMKSEIEKMRYSGTVDFFVSATAGMRVFGNMAEAVEKFIQQYGLRDVEDEDDLRAVIENIVRMHDIPIHFNGAGDCHIKARPMESRCQEAGAGPSWMRDVPNYVTRSVSMCLGCGCFGLHRGHLPFYLHREEKYRDAAADPTNRVAVERYEQTRKIILLIQEGK